MISIVHVLHLFMYHEQSNTHPRSLERLIEQLKAIMLFIVMSITRLILYGYTVALDTCSNNIFDPVHVWSA